MGVTVPEYQRIIQDALGCQLLHFTDADDGEESSLDRLPDRGPDPEGLTLDDSMRQAVIDAVQELPERERLVLSLYYEQELNLKEIGVVLKVTESRVCQLHGQALLRLKARLLEWHS
jgi:RNA polymerase sigma factor for flagellar operon FliA